MFSASKRIAKRIKQSGLKYMFLLSFKLIQYVRAYAHTAGTLKVKNFSIRQ